MNEILKVESMEFTADIAGALEETRVNPKIVVEVIRAVAKIITAAM
jgi:hypothetical protein